MDVSASSWFVILLSVFGANLPFLNERVFAVLPYPRAVKPLWLRLVELLLLYALVLTIAWLVEGRVGKVATQGWEFYVITMCLFLVFAFPGFVFRYLRRPKA